ncbi:ThuA domain-containing protein [Granulosicoccus sp.]|nr:ThuA domain-containing protein [Granulosicoccus sp.]
MIPYIVLCRRSAIVLSAALFVVSGCSSSNSPDSALQDTTTDTSAEVETPDPSETTTTTVQFDITVPRYVSNALHVRLTTKQSEIQVQLVGDEFWSVTTQLPANTSTDVVITFFDDNGDITLGQAEQTIDIGNNDLQLQTITADQFDTSQWDDDDDGVSNIDELTAGTDPRGAARVLFFTETRGFRHDSIADALAALEELATADGILFDQADDSDGVFTDDNLAQYDAVVWALTSGDVLDDEEQLAFERYIGAGGGYAGIHAASDTEHDWPWYGDLVGAYFESHPEIQLATQIVEDSDHPSTSHLRPTWIRTDEWYDYQSNPRAHVNVLLTLDESSYTGGQMGDDHPSAWYHEFSGGRSWYTGGGHTANSYSEEDFRIHLLGGLRYAAGLD